MKSRFRPALRGEIIDDRGSVPRENAHLRYLLMPDDLDYSIRKDTSTTGDLHRKLARLTHGSQRANHPPRFDSADVMTIRDSFPQKHHRVSVAITRSAFPPALSSAPDRRFCSRRFVLRSYRRKMESGLGSSSSRS